MEDMENFTTDELMNDMYDNLVRLQMLNRWADGSYRIKDHDVEKLLCELQHCWVYLQFRLAERKVWRLFRWIRRKLGTKK